MNKAGSNQNPPSKALPSSPPIPNPWGENLSKFPGREEYRYILKKEAPLFDGRDRDSSRTNLPQERGKILYLSHNGVLERGGICVKRGEMRRSDYSRSTSCAREPYREDTAVPPITTGTGKKNDLADEKWEQVSGRRGRGRRSSPWGAVKRTQKGTWTVREPIESRGTGERGPGVKIGISNEDRRSARRKGISIEKSDTKPKSHPQRLAREGGTTQRR